MEGNMNDFIVDSKGHCFLCLSKISLPPEVTSIKLEPGTEASPPPTTTYSLEYLSTYLNMEIWKTFTELLATVESSRLKVELCEGCVELVEAFSEQYRLLLQLQMDLKSSLGDIQEKMLGAAKSGNTQQFRRLIASQGISSGSGMIEIVEVLRMEAMQKCSRKLSSDLTAPQAKPPQQPTQLASEPVIKPKPPPPQLLPINIPKKTTPHFVSVPETDATVILPVKRKCITKETPNKELVLEVDNENRDRQLAVNSSGSNSDNSKSARKKQGKNVVLARSRRDDDASMSTGKGKKVEGGSKTAPMGTKSPEFVTPAASRKPFIRRRLELGLSPDSDPESMMMMFCDICSVDFSSLTDFHSHNKRFHFRERHKCGRERKKRKRDISWAYSPLSD